jgi:predicted DNA-binding transcriptional regulator AlpA
MNPVDTTPAAAQALRPALYTQHDITSRGSFSKSHLYNLIARGHFPAPVLKDGPRFTRWSAVEVDAWLADPRAYLAANAKVQA